MTMRSIRIVLLTCLAFGVGCATSPTTTTEPLPRHPFPRWVSHLETERTDIEEVRPVFGEPIEIEERRGETRWRYALREIHWAPDDPDRPEVAADGTRRPRTPTTWEQVEDGFEAAGSAIGKLIFYPATRPSRPRTRSMPATIHELELRFREDGTLRRYRYAPREERVQFRPER